ncbi:transposase [Streptomyces griseus]|uniref:transposase n=1 Tax=Streptomyces griseus TaxID=1911 RepID=UPI0037F68ABC
MLPPARVRPKGGRRVRHPRRRIVDEVFYVVRTGCAWRQLPKDFAPWPTVYWYFTWWHDDGTVERIHDALRNQVRQADGRNAEPSSGDRLRGRPGSLGDHDSLGDDRHHASAARTRRTGVTAWSPAAYPYLCELNRRAARGGRFSPRLTRKA